MDLGLVGKHALVTGSTAGIGYAIARNSRPRARAWSSAAARRPPSMPR